MILQKLERTLDTTRKGSDLGIESRIEIIGSWGYESVLKANWERPKCHAKDFIKIWGREPMAIVWVRAEQDSNRESGVVYTCFQFVCPHLLGSPLDHTTCSFQNHKWPPCCYACWTMLILILLGLRTSADTWPLSPSQNTFFTWFSEDLTLPVFLLLHCFLFLSLLCWLLSSFQHLTLGSQGSAL